MRVPIFPGDSMANWVIPDAVSFMPPALVAAYSLLNLDLREAEVQLILDGVVADFRAATLAGSDAEGVLDPKTVPVACLRHVTAIVWYILAGELGVDQTALRPAWQDAEIYLRQIMRDVSSGGSSVSGAAGNPLYSAGPFSSRSDFPSGSKVPSPGSDGRGVVGAGGGSGSFITLGTGMV